MFNLPIIFIIMGVLVLMFLKVKYQGIVDEENGVEPAYIEDFIFEKMSEYVESKEDSDETDLDTKDN